MVLCAADRRWCCGRAGVGRGRGRVRRPPSTVRRLSTAIAQHGGADGDGGGGGRGEESKIAGARSSADGRSFAGQCRLSAGRRHGPRPRHASSQHPQDEEHRRLRQQM